MASATKCPDCAAPTVSRSVTRPRLCAECYAERRRQSRARWDEQNPGKTRAAIHAYKEAHREEIRIKGRIVLVRDLTCSDCGAAFERAGSRGRFPTWCPGCRAVRDARINAKWRLHHPEASRDSAKRGGAIRRAAGRAITADKVQRLVVFERDAWTCQLCHEPVDPGLPWPAPRSPSLDHVLPLSKGGDHTYLNTQLAHLRCNLRKSDRVTPEAI